MKPRTFFLFIVILTNLIVLLILLTSCKKPDIEQLPGLWLQKNTDRSGTHVSILRIAENRYTIQSYLQLPDGSVLQAPAGAGSYSLKASGFTFRSDNNNFDWAEKGKLLQSQFTIYSIFGKETLVFNRATEGECTPDKLFKK